MRLRPPPRSPTFGEISRRMANSPLIGGAAREGSVSVIPHAKLVRAFQRLCLWVRNPVSRKWRVLRAEIGSNVNWGEA